MATLTINNQNKKTSSVSITEKVKSFEDACEVLGIAPGHVLDVSSSAPAVDKHLSAIAAFTKLVIIAEALNEGWKPNWKKSNEYKYYPWFDLSAGFSFHRVSYYDSHSGVGSRLCFRSRELAEYMGKQFLDLYKDFMVLE